MISQTTMDSNVVANGIMRDIIDVDRLEKLMCTELSSADLFKIDCAILSSLRSTQDFSRDLLEQLENGKFESIAVKPPKTSENVLENIQKQTILDITLPLQDMFDEMANYVTEAIRS